MTNHNNRDDDLDWPEDDLNQPASKSDSELPEPEDDAAKLPIRHPPKRRPAQRRRGTYRPPSELDHE